MLLEGLEEEAGNSKPQAKHGDGSEVRQGLSQALAQEHVAPNQGRLQPVEVLPIVGPTTRQLKSRLFRERQRGARLRLPAAKKENGEQEDEGREC